MSERVICKFPFEVVSDVVEIEMPVGFVWLDVQTQRGVPTIWAIVDPKAEKKVFKFRIRGTGHPFEHDENQRYRWLGTFQQFDGQLVWHLFEEGP